MLVVVWILNVDFLCPSRHRVNCVPEHAKVNPLIYVGERLDAASGKPYDVTDDYLMTPGSSSSSGLVAYNTPHIMNK